MDGGISKEQFNGATGGLISIDEDDDLNIESHTFQRVWRVYSGQLEGTDPSDGVIEEAVKISSLGTVFIASFFWSWAFFNTFFQGSFDLGFISFVFPMITNLWGWHSTRESEHFEAMRYCKRYKLAPYAHLIVTLNYALGAYAAPSFTFRIYCSIFTILWALSIYFTKNLSEKWFWVVSDREGTGGFRQPGQPASGYGVPSSSLLGSPKSSGNGSGGFSKVSTSENVFESLDEFDDETEEFVAEL